MHVKRKNASGDTNTVELFLDRYYVKEKSTPKGYVINNSVYVANVTVSTDGNPTAYPSVINTTNLPTEGTRKAYEQVKRGDFHFIKVDVSISDMNVYRIIKYTKSTHTDAFCFSQIPAVRIAGESHF